MFRGVAKQAFGRINTSVSITMASYISIILSKYMPRARLVLVSVVIFVLLLCLSYRKEKIFVKFMSDVLLLCLSYRKEKIFVKSSNAFVTARSIMGIVVTTTIMQTISEIGSAMVVDASGIKGSLLLHDVHDPRLPALILGTSFVLGIGCMPNSLRSTDEGSAMYVGVQYAYSDIIIGLVPFPSVRRMFSLMFLVLLPIFSSLFPPSDQANGPLETLFSAFTFTGVSFVMDTVMPISTGNMGEDIARAIGAIFLVHALSKSVTILSREIAPFSIWLVARKFSTMFQQYTGLMEAIILVTICVGIIKSIHQTLASWIGANTVVHILYDLFVLVDVYLISTLVMNSTMGNDTLILLLCVMAIAKILLTLF